MADDRYFLPDHASLKDVYSKDDLREMLQAGKLSRSDIVFDDETGLSHLLGDLLMSAYRESRGDRVRTTPGPAGERPREHEFRAHTPLPRPETDGEGDDDSGCPPDEETCGLHRGGPMQQSAEEELEESDGEELLYHGHPSWRAYPKSVGALFAFGGAAWLFGHFHAGLGWVIVSGALAVLPVLFVWLDRTTTSYFITSCRVEVESGIIGRSTKEVRIPDIRAIDVVQHGFNALVGIGNVKFDSSAGPNAEVEFVNVRRPHDLKHAVRELQG